MGLKSHWDIYEYLSCFHCYWWLSSNVQIFTNPKGGCQEKWIW